jgi:hypothetical protein
MSKPKTVLVRDFDGVIHALPSGDPQISLGMIVCVAPTGMQYVPAHVPPDANPTVLACDPFALAPLPPKEIEPGDLSCLWEHASGVVVAGSRHTPPPTDSKCWRRIARGEPGDEWIEVHGRWQVRGYARRPRG